MIRVFTPAEISAIRQQHRAGKSFIEIGQALGRPASSVANKARLLGLERRIFNQHEWSDAELKQVAALCKKGLSYVEIGRILGLSASAVRKAHLRAIDPARQAHSKAYRQRRAKVARLLDRAEELVASGLSQTEAAMAVGINPSSLIDRIKRKAADRVRVRRKRAGG